MTASPQQWTQGLLSAQETGALVFRATNDGVCLVDLHTHVLLRANARLGQMLGCDPEQLLGVPSSALSSDEPEGASGRERSFGPVHYDRPGLVEEVNIAFGDGAPCVVNLRVSHEELAGRRVAVCLLQDDTRHRMLEQELIQKHVALLDAHRDLAARQKQIAELTAQVAKVGQRAMLAEVVAEVAHSMNNPLAALTSNLRRLGKLRPAIPEEQLPRFDKLIGGCERNAKRMTRSVEDLRINVRHQSRGDRPGVSNFAQVAEHACQALEHRSEQCALSFHGEEELLVRGHITEIHHACVNLIDNALQAAAGRVEVRLVQDGPNAALWVCDDGPGVAEQLQQEIFEPFFTTKPLGQGTGVGLSMVRRLAQRRGGSVDVRSPGSLGGADFVFRLPLAVSPGEEQ